MPQQAQFAHSLETSIALAHRLEAALLAETEAIERREPDRLEQIVADKKRLADQLEQETLQQKRWVEESNHIFNPAGMSQFLLTLDPDRALASRWAVLRESIVRCDQMNRTNAQLINRDRKRVNLSLRILRGDDGDATTYDPRGRARLGGERSRSISRA